MDEKVYLSDYNIEWENQFNSEKELLQFYLPDVFIEHIGSTSIKGMRAKPIIDMLLGVITYPPPEETLIILEKSGYYDFSEEAKVKEHGRLYLAKRGTVNYNVHVTEYLGGFWHHIIRFRNYLREHEDEALEYSRIKQYILNKGIDNLVKYSQEKEIYLSNIINIINNR